MKIHDATLLTSITCNIYILRLPTYLRPFTSPSISTQLPRVLFVPVNLLQGRTLLAEMLLPSIYALIVASSCLTATVLGQNSSTSPSPSTTSSSPFTLYTISSDNITAKFIPYGARLTSLLVPDRNGTAQDVVVGYDSGSRYLQVCTTLKHTTSVLTAETGYRNKPYVLWGCSWTIRQQDQKQHVHDRRPVIPNPRK